jgi:hypothetical protein
MTIAKNQQELWKYEVSSIDQSLLIPFCIACPVLPFLKKTIVTHVKNLRLMPLHFMIFYNKKRNPILLQKKRPQKLYTLLCEKI